MALYLHAMRFWYSEFCKLKRDIKKWKAEKTYKFQQKHLVLEKINDNILIIQQTIDSLTMLESEQNGNYLSTLNLAILQCELDEARDRIEAGLNINW